MPASSRRSALIHLPAAVLLLGMPTPAAADPAADADLLAACATCRAAWAEEKQLAALPMDTTAAEEAAISARLDACMIRMRDAMEVVATTPAQTLAGLRAKADPLLCLLPDAVEGFQLEQETEEVQLALGFARDVLRLCGSVPA